MLKACSIILSAHESWIHCWQVHILMLTSPDLNTDKSWIQSWQVHILLLTSPDFNPDKSWIQCWQVLNPLLPSPQSAADKSWFQCWQVLVHCWQVLDLNYLSRVKLTVGMKCYILECTNACTMYIDMNMQI